MIINDMSDIDYHNHPALSSTGARTLLPEFKGSPAKYQHKLGRRYDSPAFDLGKAVHARVLGVGAQAVAYPDDVLASNGAASTKAAKEWAESIRVDGGVPMKADDLRPISRMAEAVLAHPAARRLLEAATAREVSVFADVDGVPTRCRFDALGGGYGIDLKTSARPVDADTFSREVFEYGYHFQQEFYRDTYRASEDEFIAFAFIAVEKTGPHLVAVHQLDFEYEQIGKRLAKDARRIYAECSESGMWPGHPEDIQLVSPPAWAIDHEEMSF
ncbi:PD-(D/E)XK nuclease-like domain-containing protein [Microbacterium oxydans]|uniref:PD-(D/E)XK nuclease-like domain-containing protein n=1 Tax=Microbacterium oxydans TaxID=82380 RepID=UPI0037CC4AA6